MCELSCVCVYFDGEVVGNGWAGGARLRTRLKKGLACIDRPVNRLVGACVCSAAYIILILLLLWALVYAVVYTIY